MVQSHLQFPCRNLTPWSEAEAWNPPLVSDNSLPNAHVTSPFPIREDLNKKVALW